MLPFGQTVLLWRMRKGLTQAALAQAAGIPRPNLSAIERGAREVSLRTIRALAHALMIRPGLLVDGQPPTEPTPALTLDRSQLGRLARAVVYERSLAHKDEQALAQDLRELTRHRLEAAGIGLASRPRPKRLQSLRGLTLRHQLPKAVLNALLDKISDEATRRAHEHSPD